MRPPHLHLSAASDAQGGLGKLLLLPLLMAQFWGEAGTGAGGGPGKGRRWENGLLLPSLPLTSPPLGTPQPSPTGSERPGPKSDPPLF